jgi:hypothetical protein
VEEFEMKLPIVCVTLLALALGLSAANRAAVPTTCGLARAACCVDDPPPEPVDCPMCAGNAQVHVRRLLLIQQHIDCVALYATRW